MEPLLKKLIPDQKDGKHNHVEESVSAADESQAIEKFRSAEKSLLDVNHWNKITGKASADFCVMDKSGNKCDRPVEKSDYIRIDIPGPGSGTGEGYDWVKVEEMEKAASEDRGQEGTGFTVRACSNPNNEDRDTAHFFTDEATSTFIIQRQGKRVTATYYGRNEKVNTQTNGLADKVRNAVVGSGAKAGISEIQWKALVKAFLE